MKSNQDRLRGGGVDIKPLMRLTLFSLVLLFCCSSLAAYPLYVHPAADIAQADGSEEYPYRYIQDAIDHAFDNTNPDNQGSPRVVIWLADTISIYQENLIVDFRGGTEPRLVQDLSIKNLGNNPDECKIISQDPHQAIITVRGYNYTNFRLQGLYLEQAPQVDSFMSYGIELVADYSSPSDINYLQIDNCVFKLCTHSLFIDQHYSALNSIVVTNSVFEADSAFLQHCVGIQLSSRAQTLHVAGNKFISPNPSLNYCAIDAGQNASRVDIIDNEFSASSVMIGRESYEGSGQELLIEGNTFSMSTLNIKTIGGPWIIDHNEFIGFVEDSSYVAIDVIALPSTIPVCWITDNVFVDVHIPLICRQAGVGHYEAIDFKLLGNSIIGQGSVSRLYLKNYNPAIGPWISEYKNNLYTGSSTVPFEFCDSSENPIEHPNARVHISHSHFSTQLDTANPFLVLGEGIGYGDPLIDYDEFSNTYSLLWDENQKSPLINSEYPGESGELTDPDGTPPDIGSVYYPHVNRKYFERSPSEVPIVWLSFPVLDDRSNTDGIYWNELGYMFSEHMQGPPVSPSQLDQIQWSYDGERPTMKYDIDTWQYSFSHAIQQKGYKVQFNTPGEISDVVVNGFKVDAATTPIVWLAEMEENGVSRPFENWIGYFAPFTQKAGYAFSRLLPGSSRDRYLDYIYSMKTQRWSTCRESASHDSPWIIDPNSYTLSEGEMVSLVLLPDAPQEMFWDLSSSPVKPRDIPKSTAFNYDEKLDYQPIYIEFDPEDMPDEIGLYVDGLCKGAAVVDTSLISVCLYNEAAKDGGEIELVFFYEGKGKCVSPAWTVYNSDTMVFEDSGLRADQIGDYAYISFTREEGESSSPLVTSLRQNYPNPFNPSTTISFVLGSESEARLDIFNARGQLVKSFQYDQLAKGLHTVEWNGKDSTGRSVSSGLYLYKLSSSGTSIVKKMLLVK